MADSTLRVAVVGYGHAGRVFHAPLIASTPGMSVSAIVTANAERSARAHVDFPDARVVPSAEDVWSRASDYDLAVIATPNSTHVALGLSALQAGLAVVIDKPVAASVSEARTLIDAAQAGGHMLTVFHNARWSVPFLTARQVIASGALGPLTSFEARMERYRPLPRPGAWRERGSAEEAGGLLYDLGSHLIDQALQLFGTPTHVYAELERRRPATEVDDDSFVALRFESGVRARLWMSYVARLPGAALRLAGLRGTYVREFADGQEALLQAGLRPGDAGWNVEPRDQWGRLSADVNGLHVDGPIENAPGGYEQFYALLRDALLHGGPPPVDPHDTLHALRVIEAAQHSARTFSVVRMDPN
jgi:predicted dehydrogenase